MARSYKGVRPKKHRVYDVEGLMSLYAVSANTVSNWVAEGLRPSGSRTPYRFQGTSIAHFHRYRKERSLSTLRPGEFKCVTCKEAMFPGVQTIEDLQRSGGKHMFRALCTLCGSETVKISSAADRDIVEDCRNPNSSKTSLHEENMLVPAGIWTSEEINGSPGHFRNDRIIFEWQTYAGRYNNKTIDQHLAAIRYCEHVTKGKAFIDFRKEDAARVRDDLKRRAISDAVDCLSSSSISHIVSHLEAFFVWLMKQDGYKRMPKDLPDYFKLPKAILAAAASISIRAFASLKDAEDMLRKMPQTSLIEQRHRAIIATAYLTGLRADTLVSLRIEHVDVENKVVAQDGKVSRAKAGKSLWVKWFPAPEIFVEIVINWLHTLAQRGFEGNDALFPSADQLNKWRKLSQQVRAPVPVMTTTHAVTDAFAKASSHGLPSYLPHSVKDTLAAERDHRPLTAEQRKAWSLNLGHEDERTTEIYYAKMTAERRMELIEEIGKDDTLLIEHMSDEQKIALVNEIAARMR